ncbi:Uncharacterised protein family UPF0390 [Phaffia rhodozyma]|uniref:Uncharacterized protein family UPF0390 n=1 Tax=Phaffia rhodozyma TaxID=264483 RepID=A0A0F7SFK6_PHARH|nr:Uncharacterised protein family UPF0390 [Phaffia rhodozyma]
MAQNSSNKLASASGSGGRKTKSTTKKGARSVPPKKHTAVVSRTMQKNLSAKINNSIERQMVNAASGGKLTIMKGSGDPTDKAKDTKGVSKPTKSGLKFDKPNPHDRANI